MKNSSKLTPKWYDQRSWAMILMVLGLGLLYLLLLRATDTGSLQQYGFALIVLVFVVSRVGNVLRKEKKV
jgi:hypothetical protein